MSQCQPLRETHTHTHTHTSGLCIFFKVEYDLFDLADQTYQIHFCRTFPFLIPPFHFSTLILQNSEPLDILYNNIPQSGATIWEPFSHSFSFLKSLLLLLLSCFSRVRLCVTPRRQPTRLPGPWDSPGKNTGVGCHFLLKCMKVKSESEVSQLCRTVSDPMGCSLPGSSVNGIFPGKSTGMGGH